MCMLHDGVEMCAIWNEKDFRARKDHTCDECGRTIPKGEIYTRISALAPGDGWSNAKFCRHCQKIANWLIENCDGYLMGCIAQDFIDHMDQFQWSSQMRAVWGLQNQWRRTNGELMQPPVYIAPLGKELN